MLLTVDVSLSWLALGITTGNKSISEKSAHNLAGMFRENTPGRCLIYIAQSSWRGSPVKVDVSVCAIDGPEPLW